MLHQDLVNESGKTSFLTKTKQIRRIPLSDQCNTNPTQIVMYTTEYCSDCRRAKAFFESNSIEYLNIGLEGNKEATEFVMKLNNGNQSVPTIIFPDGSVLVEPGWSELSEAIKKIELSK